MPDKESQVPKGHKYDATSIKVLGGIEAVLFSRLSKGESEDLESLLPSLMYFVVLPYEGHEAASGELAVKAG